jgi:hypothetical protein
MLKTLSLVVLAVFLTLAPCVPLLANAEGKEPVEPLVPRAAFAPAAASKGGPLGLIAKKFVSFDPILSLVPTNPLVAETLETAVMLSLSIPAAEKRTHFLLATGALTSWEQISSTAPYRLTGALRYRLTSSALPAPGEMGFGGVVFEGQIDAQPSAADISRIRDQTSSFGLDDEVLAFLVKGNFPTLTDEQALQTARALIKSEIGMTMTVRVRAHSVSEFTIGNAYLQVWGD